MPAMAGPDSPPSPVPLQEVGDVPPRLRLVGLKTRSEFLAVAGAKRKYATPGLLLQARARPDGDGTAAGVGFTVSRKVGNAVTRNRAKRRLRSLAREWLTVLAKGGADYVLIGRHDTPARPYQDLVGDLRLALRKLRLQAGDGEVCGSQAANNQPDHGQPNTSMPNNGTPNNGML